MADDEPFDAGNMAFVHDAGFFGHVRRRDSRPDFGKDAFSMVGEEIWSSWAMGGEGDGAKVLA
jgi:hypothetical protein